MVLRTSLARALLSHEHKSNTSTSAPCLAGLFGFKKEPQPSRITALREALSIPVSNPTLADVLSSLPSGLCRKRISRSSDLCSVHSSLSMGPLIKITNLLTYELHPRLAHLYQFPRVCLSPETRTHLYKTLKPYRTYFREEPSADADRKDDGESSIGATCLACTLSLFFQDEAAVEALAVCAKSRQRHGAEWPPLLDWLEPGKRKKGWEERWRLDGQSYHEGEYSADRTGDATGHDQEQDYEKRRSEAHGSSLQDLDWVSLDWANSLARKLWRRPKERPIQTFRPAAPLLK
ncbi:hypothetical protein MMC29_000959 [Sticta canariensis]|nr:hypothetical protein [Sticta canariensis]